MQYSYAFHWWNSVMQTFINSLSLYIGFSKFQNHWDKIRLKIAFIFWFAHCINEINPLFQKIYERETKDLLQSLSKAGFRHERFLPLYEAPRFLHSVNVFRNPHIVQKTYPQILVLYGKIWKLWQSLYYLLSFGYTVDSSNYARTLEFIAVIRIICTYIICRLRLDTRICIFFRYF